MEVEHVATCPVCGDHDFIDALTTQDFPLTQEQFDIVRCATCGLGITNPRPTAATIGKYYDPKRYISHSGGGNRIIDRAYRTVRAYSLNQKLKLIARHLPPGKVLDYGCGTGEFLEAASHHGWTCAGIEPSADARKKIPPHIPVHASLASLQQSDERYNLITMWHVLEHVHDLNQTLSHLKSKLYDGGIIFIAVPNPESYDAIHYGKHWAGYDVPRHLWHFPKKALTRLLSAHNFSILEIHPMKFDAFYVSLLSEAYRTPGATPGNALRALATGLRSNSAANGDNYSSLIYIARS